MRIVSSLSKFLLVVALAAFATPAWANVFYSQLGTLNPPANPASNVILVSGTGGGSYSNVVGAPAIGSTVFAVGGSTISNTNNAFFPLSTPQDGFWSGGGSTGVAVFAVQGTITSLSGTNATVTFNAGTINVYQVPTGSFDFRDPATWGTGGPLLAQWTLGAPADIVKGNPLADGSVFSASQVNIISATIAANQLLLGSLLWDKPTNNTLFVASTFDPFGAANAVLEQLHTRVDETIVADYTGPLTLPNLIAALNEILSQSGLSSTGFNDYDPNLGSGTLDFFANFGFRAVPGVQFFVIPEPASVLLWGSLGVGAVALGRFRRRRST